MKRLISELARIAFAGAMLVTPAAAQQATPPQTENSPAATSAAPLPPGYVIGAEDVLSIVFWRDKDLSADVVVRPDGKISLPLLNDIQAAGHTPDSLRAVLMK